MRSDTDEDPGRTVLAGLAAMASVALVVGLVVGLVALGAARVVGIGDPSATGPGKPESLYIPPYRPTPTVEQEWPGLPSPRSGGRPSASPDRGGPAEQRDEEQRRNRKVPPITLRVSSTSVSPGERIDLSGVYRKGGGVSLQVQRKDGAVWADFPVTAAVRGGVFATWIQTSRTGRQLLRVMDPVTGRLSNTVTVTVG